MSQLLINQYLGELDRLKKVGETHRESVVREAFKDLLKGWGRQHDLVFIPEYKLDSATNDTRFVDGALYVNPGSVGLAYDRFDSDPVPIEVAEYALVTGGSVEFRRVPWQSES